MGDVGGWVVGNYSENNATLWLHLARWNMPEFVGWWEGGHTISNNHVKHNQVEVRLCCGYVGVLTISPTRTAEYTTVNTEDVVMISLNSDKLFLTSPTRPAEHTMVNRVDMIMKLPNSGKNILTFLACSSVTTTNMRVKEHDFIKSFTTGLAKIANNGTFITKQNVLRLISIY